VIRALAALAAAFALAGCGGTETVTVTESRTETDTETVSETTTVTETSPNGLPAPVAETHAALLAAAESGDYEQLRPFLPEEFSYTFGSPVAGGPIEYWQQVEAESGESPIERLAQVLELPYTLYGGTYVWPFAYDKRRNELTRYERGLLVDLAVFSGAGSGYLGWRAGIDPEGTWRFFIAGD
jgi:hypothetical protein